MTSTLGLSLRSELYSPDEILAYSRLADKSSGLSHLFFPDIPNSFDALELVAASLGVTERIKAGSGVIRLLEHDRFLLKRRLETIQFLSKNRMFLGVGAGRPKGKPSETIMQMLNMVDELKQDFTPSEMILMPEVFVASLGSFTALESMAHAEGILLNFCSPEYARSIAEKLRAKGGIPTIACYLKIFFSSDSRKANRLLSEEFARYNLLPHYHKMFEKDGVENEIQNASEDNVPKSLRRVSLANPTMDELEDYVRQFISSGVTLPVLYPYFSPDERREYKDNVFRDLLSLSFGN